MSECSVIHLAVNGRKVEGRKGQTILEVCRAAGIYIPTLCYHPRLSIVGACRMCMVEVEGSKKLQASCSTPAVDGMVIQTDTEQLREYRRLNLEFLFSERNHVCPFCESSGACELQQLAYEHKMESIRVEYLAPRLPTDLSSPYFGLDHNRCILCGRCVRVCDEIEGVHTLDLAGRGGKTLVGVDLHGELGGGTCTMCGACVQVCPTGALYDKMPAYRGRPQDLEGKSTTCPGCGVGCGLIAETRYGQVIRVLGDEDCGVNDGHTCRIGRYESIVYGQKRIERPQLNGTENETDWDDVLPVCKKSVAGTNGKKTVLALNSRATLEACMEARALLDALGGNAVATLLNLDLPLDPTPVPDYEIFQKADVIWVLDCDPARSVPVIGSMIRRRTRKKKVKLVVCTRRVTELNRHADAVLDLKLLDLADLIIKGLGQGDPEFPPELDRRTVNTLNTCLDKTLRHVIVTSDRPDRRGRVLTFPKDRLKSLHDVQIEIFHISVGTNALGIAGLLKDRLVDRRDLHEQEIGTLIAAPGDLMDERTESTLQSLAERAAVTILLSSFKVESHPKATITLPVATWWEEGPGHVVNLSGKICPVSPVVSPRGKALPLADALQKLAAVIAPETAAESAQRRDPKTIQEQLAKTWGNGKEKV
ncbi:MAG: 2Fe-2S iron-sulfur cluster-binding protein [bacterium]